MNRIKIGILFFLILNILTNACSQNIISKNIPRTEIELENIFLKKLYEGYLEESTEASEYSQKVSKDINMFLEKLNFISENDYPALVGIWKLCDRKGNFVADSNEFFLSNSLLIVNQFNHLYLFNADSETEIVKNNEDIFYFKTRWINCIRQLRIIDNQMYIYTLDGDNWILDKIHENGKYAFIKH